MTKRNYPLELVIRPHGVAELLDDKEKTLWASDNDPEFKEEVTDEFLGEDDADDVLEYLVDMDIISEIEYDKFDTEEWEINVESLDSSINDIDEDTNEEYDEDEEGEEDDEED